MDKIDLLNGNKIYPINSSNNIRGKRAELVSFDCSMCKSIHVDYPRNNLIYYKGLWFCKESTDCIK